MIGQGSTLADEDGFRITWCSGLKILDEQPSSFMRQGDKTLLIALSLTTNELSRSLSDSHVVKFKTNDLRRSQPTEQHDADDNGSGALCRL